MNRGTNDLGYFEINAKKFRPLGDRILVDWEEAQDDIKAGKLTLVRPDTHKKIHYTGVVISVGPDVDESITPGGRIIFDQFSNFEKLWDEDLGRLALISENAQASAFAVVPPRVKIGEGEGDYNYEK